MATKTEKRLDEIHNGMHWFKVPPKVYFKRGAIDLALKELQGRKRAFIVTDTFLFNSGAINKVTDVLEKMDVEYQIFFDVKSDPTFSTINQGLAVLRPFEPDVIIALGGGSPIDTAKIMWLLYEQPDIKIENLAMRNIDEREEECFAQKLGQKAMMVAIPTTSGTGSEVTPFASICDEKTGVKYAIADYVLTPDMAIVDPNFVDRMPAKLTATSGMDALVNAIEAYSSSMSTNFTNSNALEAIKLVFRYLERAYKDGFKDPRARERMHYVATIAGMAFANSFYGLALSLSHKLVSMFAMPHGIASALIIRQIIKYNAADKPKEQCIFPRVKLKYGQIADELTLGGKNDDEKVKLLVNAITNLMKNIDIPNSISEFGISEKDFYSKLDEMVELSYNDQCSGASKACFPKKDIKQIYVNAFEGKF